MSIVAAWAALPSGDLRNVPIRYISGTATIQAQSDTDFTADRVVELAISATNAAGAWRVPHGTVTMAVGDEVNLVGQMSVETCAPGNDVDVCGVSNSRRPALTVPQCMILLEDDDQLKVSYDTSGTSRTSTATYTVTLGTPFYYRMRFKRTATSGAEAELYIWESGAWSSKGSVTNTDAWTNTALKSMWFGNFSAATAKGGSLTIRHEWAILGYNETPVVTTLWEAALPDGDGATEEWTDNAGGTNNSAAVDDAFGSESGTDYSESTSTTLEKKQEFTAAAMSAIGSGTVLGLNMIAGVAVPTGSPAAATYTVNPKLSGSEDAQDAYYGDTVYGASATTDGGDIHYFFATKPGGGAWTQTNINDATYQFEKEATGGAVNFRVNSFAIQAFYEPAAAGGTARAQAYVFD